MPVTETAEVQTLLPYQSTKAEQLLHYLGALNHAPISVINTDNYQDTYQTVISAVNKELAL